MAKVTIIDIDLGINVEEIIASKVVELNAGTQEKLDNYIRVQQLAQQKLDEEKAKSKEDPSKIILQNIFEKIESKIQEGNDGLEASIIEGLLPKDIPNMSAFCLKMNNMLKGQGKRIKRISRNSTPYYTIISL